MDEKLSCVESQCVSNCVCVCVCVRTSRLDAMSNKKWSHLIISLQVCKQKSQLNKLLTLQIQNSWILLRASDGQWWLAPWWHQWCDHSMFGQPLTPQSKWMYYECPTDGSPSLLLAQLQVLIDICLCQDGSKWGPTKIINDLMSFSVKQQ